MTEAPKETKPRYAVPAVDRMLDILEFLAERRRPYGTTELSRTLGISTNLVFRIMKRLTDRGYAEMDADSGGYQLSTRFFSLGMRLYYRFELRLRARKHLEWLCRETGETCQLQTLDGDRMLVLDTIAPPADFFLNIVPGSRVLCHANAFAKAVMAFMPKPDVDAILDVGMPKLAPGTLTAKADFLNELETARETGLTYDREEYMTGIFCVGAPVFDVEGKPVAGIGVTGLSSRFDQSLLANFEGSCLRCAHAISKDIGYTGDFFDTKIKVKAQGRNLKPKI